MSRVDYAARVVSELGRALGLPDLELDDQARASFSKNGIAFTLSYSDSPIELFWIIVDLGPFESDSHEALMGLLEFNYLTWISNVMTIGLGSDGDRAIGHFCLPLSYLDTAQVESQLERMIESATLIRQRIADGNYELPT